MAVRMILSRNMKISHFLQSRYLPHSSYFEVSDCLLRFGGSGTTRDDVQTTHVGPDQTVGSNRGMAKPMVRTIRGKIGGCWKQRFGDWVPRLDGRQIVVFQDAASYLVKLPKAEERLKEYQTATRQPGYI